MLKFALIGDGQVARYHRKAIEHVGGEICCVVDPKYDPTFNADTYRGVSSLHPFHFSDTDYFVICSPSHEHYYQIKYLLDRIKFSYKSTFQIICEKPAFLPWELPIDSDLINIVLQLRYLPNLPEKAEKVVAHFVRDDAYFESWKGDPKKTGGLFYNLFIHYVSLAIDLGADFEGSVQFDGVQNRWIEFGTFGLSRIDLLNIDNQDCYNRLYEAILSGNGIKPSGLFYLSWTLQRNSEIFGYSRDAIGKTIKIGRELL